MNQSTQTLPDNYKLADTIDLAANKTISLALNLASVGVALLTFWLLINFSNFIHPELSGTFSRGSFNLTGFLLMVLLIPLNMVVHEIIHGFFFWIFTNSMPIFSIKLSYIYTAAPDWYIPKSMYWIISLAPLLLIGLAGLMVMSLCPPSFVLPALVVVGFNTGGAVGDIWTVYKLSRSSRLSLVNDTGHGVYFYLPENPSNN